ncbi:MAG: prepilin-type N-terminal cleavage/methylation domain-containing protein [Candidatus Zapsychrus exili]|nr:prepilin-type N-terminal cleavage/methylation domain-containing protein [Candidatus Zapsychrus exili]
MPHSNTKKYGFTLLELIIVIIIVGVLASLALPRFFNVIKFAKSTEAVNTFGTIKRTIDRCAMMGGISMNYNLCDTWAELGIVESEVDSSTFNYTLTYSGTTYIYFYAYLIGDTSNYIRWYIYKPAGTHQGKIRYIRGYGAFKQLDQSNF